MKLENIKTEKEFYEFADIWYQRSLTLRDIWKDTSEPETRRVKAFVLWNVMKDRVLKLSSLAIKINQKVKPKKYKSGGCMIVGEF